VEGADVTRWALIHVADDTVEVWLDEDGKPWLKHKTQALAELKEESHVDVEPEESHRKRKAVLRPISIELVT
jgi:hypothetical protein